MWDNFSTDLQCLIHVEPPESNALNIVKGEHQLLVAREAGVELDGVHHDHLGPLESDWYLGVRKWKWEKANMKVKIWEVKSIEIKLEEAVSRRIQKWKNLEVISQVKVKEVKVKVKKGILEISENCHLCWSKVKVKLVCHFCWVKIRVKLACHLCWVDPREVETNE